MVKRILKIAAALLAALVVAAVGFGWWIRSELVGSLPQLDGEVRLQGITAAVQIERDGLGIPTIRAANRVDAAFATGFVHAQERCFQMDLLRRNAAGELAELIGPAVVTADRRVRVHRFRDVARRVVAEGGQQDREILEAYAAGVNAGVAALQRLPFEYLLLGQQPAPWKAEDCALVMFSMFLDLQGEDFRDEAALGLMHDTLPAPMFDFLAPLGTQWDAPVDGQPFAVAPIPGPEVFDTRRPEQVALARLAPLGAAAQFESFHPGSNNWAVAGTRTADGTALVADDMHLGINVPHIWYRARLIYAADDDPQIEYSMTGVSLPGTPAVVVGSNGHVAWGFTNSEGDWVDVVLVETDASDPGAYHTPDGVQPFERHEEVIKVHGAPDETLEVVSTIWGPIIDHDHQNRPRAMRWVAHEPGGVNMGLLRLETAGTLEDALRLANLAGSPAQNFVVADEHGRIAWTILGRMPRRVGFDGRLPASWADGSRRWDGWLSPEEYPRIIDPPDGRLWTANARVVSGEMLTKLGDGGYDLGARAGQIRDGLRAREQFTEADMLAIQLDDRAVFLEPWRQALLDVLDHDAVADEPGREELRGYVDDWGGRAAIDSVGYRVVRTFRRRLIAQLADVLVNPCKAHQENFSIAELDRTEGPVWRLVSEQPEHLIDPRFTSWRQLLLATIDQVLDEATADGGRLADYTWGQYNTTKIQHPLSKAVPALAWWLDMTAQPLPGDSENVPRIQSPTKGASQRMAVSPGREERGYMHMPCGQSGHPLSPHYRDAHAAWEDGEPTPFLPGATVHTLVLKPAA